MPQIRRRYYTYDISPQYPSNEKTIKKGTSRCMRILMGMGILLATMFSLHPIIFAFIVIESFESCPTIILLILTCQFPFKNAFLMVGFIKQTKNKSRFNYKHIMYVIRTSKSEPTKVEIFRYDIRFQF